MSQIKKQFTSNLTHFDCFYYCLWPISYVVTQHRIWWRHQYVCRPSRPSRNCIVRSSLGSADMPVWSRHCPLEGAADAVLSGTGVCCGESTLESSNNLTVLHSACRQYPDIDGHSADVGKNGCGSSDTVAIQKRPATRSTMMTSLMTSQSGTDPDNVRRTWYQRPPQTSDRQLLATTCITNYNHHPMNWV